MRLSLIHIFDIAQATEVVKGKEGGLDYMIEQGGKNLSGGQKPVSYTHLDVYKRQVSDEEHKELSPDWVHSIFTDNYVDFHPYFTIPECHLSLIHI